MNQHTPCNPAYMSCARLGNNACFIYHSSLGHVLRKVGKVLEAACSSVPSCMLVCCRGTYFARSLVSRSSPLIAQLQLPHGVPALLVAKHCALLGKAHINQFGGADIWEEQVRHSGMLVRS